MSGLESLRRRNTAQVARALLHHGACGRAEIARMTGLSATSLTKITAYMIRMRMIRELSVVTGGETGRPRVPVALDTSHYRFIGLHIGLRRTTGGLLDLAGDVVVEHAVTHRRPTRSGILAEARDLRAELQAAAGGADRVLGTGIVTGGRVDPARGVVVEHPLLGWRDVPLVTEVGPAGHPVLVDSSVRGLALAETYLGAARDTGSSVFLFIGNIVGAGLMIDGRLRNGRDAAAGTIDHLPLGADESGERCRCGRHDCLATLASDVAVLAKARSAGLVQPHASFESLVKKSRSGDPAAAGLLRTRAELAGVTAATLLDLLDPDLLVLGGGLLQTPEHLGALRSAAARRLTRPDAADRIVPTGLGEGSLVRGSASLVLHAFFTDPVGMLPAQPAGVASDGYGRARGSA
ncbi:ROK family protein [Nonomuraea guangzhouensis]|uniref:ROK family protein n=1 Tax=Nonomuraea guangzhouensis TaxID=1291555 RepID=A0ABW4G9L0_9ACTN|nr:ROK family protein [Nonomuraea guangzhouensis]